VNLALQDCEKLPTAQVLRDLRIWAGMRIRDLAKLLGLSHTLICHYEQSRQPIACKQIIEMCRIFNLSLDDLNKLLRSGDILINFKDECHLLITKMDNKKLQDVYQVLKSMAA